jgi:acetyl-CoA synthetase
MACGLPLQEAEAIALQLERVCDGSAVEAWRTVSHTVLRPTHPFAVHSLLFNAVYRDWDPSQGPPPAWVPTKETVRSTNLRRLMSARGFSSVREFQKWSATHRGDFWRMMIAELGISFFEPPQEIVELAEGRNHPRWLVGARFNIAESCFLAPPERMAIVHQREDGPIETITYAELRSLAGRVSNGLLRAGFNTGDAVAIAMPMTVTAVAIYLGLVQAGLVVVSIADSLAADEIAIRLKIADAKGIFTQDVVHRGGKDLPLYDRAAASSVRAIVVPAGENPAMQLRPGDSAWSDFLADCDQFAPIPCAADDPTNILFSSGTTGEPKAIAWNHASPLKAAADSYIFHDVHPQDRVAWPTNIGWMMGPWLIYASLVNRATMALYDGAPNGRGFGQFITNAGVTILGVVPSLVKTWRSTGCMEGLDWTSIRLFSSTGECSNPDDMRYLMMLAGYKPVIEYCGGTELAGGYIASTLLEPNVPGAFNSASMGMDFTILDESGRPADVGEVFLVPPSIGMSTRLLNGDHDAIYYEESPLGPDGAPLRRHGDAIERLPGGYFRAHGRVDDTMNLGGIKVSSAEIERTLNAIPGVAETAAIAVAPPGGGPSLLWIFAVADQSNADHEPLLAAMRRQLREHLNPLFKIERLVLIDAMPRTASNKIMRRLLRQRAVLEQEAPQSS